MVNQETQAHWDDKIHPKTEFLVFFLVFLATIDKNMFWNSIEQIWYKTTIIGITTEKVSQVPGKTTNTE
jgi:hypothetical protein